MLSPESLHDPQGEEESSMPTALLDSLDSYICFIFFLPYKVDCRGLLIGWQIPVFILIDMIILFLSKYLRILSVRAKLKKKKHIGK